MLDRFFDLHVNVPMQKIVTDRLRPPAQRDPLGVAQARALLETALGMAEREMAPRPDKPNKSWAMGDAFSMADCAAAPALYYANLVRPFGDAFPHTAAYLKRLMERPSFIRVDKEAQPYRALFPTEPVEIAHNERTA